MDPLNHNGNQHTEIVTIGHQKRQFLCSVASPLFCMCNISELAGLESVAYSGFDQSRPAGHNTAPVCSWLKPQSTFTLHARGGTRLCPLGVTQSRTAPLRLLVSSPRAPDMPLESLFICYYILILPMARQFTSSETISTSPSEPSIKHSSRPGTDLRSS